MRNVRMRKNELRQLVAANRDGHRDQYEKAFAGFRVAAAERLHEYLDILARGERPPIHLGLEVPEDHTEDYDTVLSMLDHETRPEVELTWDEYRNYVQDEWSWSGRFATTSAMYAGR